MYRLSASLVIVISTAIGIDRGFSMLLDQEPKKAARTPAVDVYWFTVNWKVGARIVQSREEIRVPLLCSRKCLSQ